MEPALLPSPSHSLHAIVVHLGAADRGILPASLGRAIHAQVLDWFRQADPSISEAIHQRQESPISLSGLIGKRRSTGVQIGDEFSFRISLLENSLMEPLLHSLETSNMPKISLGQFPFTICKISMLPGTDPWVGSADYALLARSPVTQNDLTLRFVSPTSFKLKEGQGIQPFPLPDSVFGSLQRRWNAFAPEELRLPSVRWSGLVSDYDLKTQKFRMENSVERGAIGWARYRFPDPEQARIATILAHFAFFAGVGRKTAMGMGQTRLLNHSEE